jgi:Holliday junction resolvase
MTGPVRRQVVTNPSKDKGTRFETAVVDYLRSEGFDHVERRALRGGKDCGDIAGLAGWTLECKAEKTIALGRYMDESELEAINADPQMVSLGGIPLHAAIVKRRNRGVQDAYVVMPLSQFAHLLLADKWYEERRQASVQNPE